MAFFPFNFLEISSFCSILFPFSHASSVSSTSTKYLWGRAAPLPSRQVRSRSPRRYSSPSTSNCDPAISRSKDFICFTTQDPETQSESELDIVVSSVVHLVSLRPYGKPVGWAGQVSPFCSCGNWGSGRWRPAGGVSLWGLPQQRAIDWVAHSEIYCLSVLGARSARSGCWQGCSLLRPLSLACRWLPYLSSLWVCLHPSLLFLKGHQ